MTEAARLTLVVDHSTLKQADNALDSLARTGTRVEGKLTISAKSIENAMASLGATIGNLDRTMQSVERAVTGSMGRTTQEVARGARSFDDLRRSIDPAYAASQRFAEVQREVAAMVAAGDATQRAANIVLEQANSRYMGVATASERAEQAARELSQAKQEEARALAQATGSYQAMRASIDPVFAASKRYEAAIETANAALKAKIITEGEHARVMQMAQSHYLGLVPAADAARTGVSRFGSQMTNASFQVQDFFVQIASGQSMFIAFAQQFPQLAGVFGFSGTLALVGAGLGTLVAVGAAVAPMFFDIGKGATSAKDAVDAVAGSFGSYQSAVDGATMSMVDAYAKFGDNAQAARDLYAITVDLARLEFASTFSASIGALAKPLSDLRGDLKFVDIALRDAGAASADFDNAAFALQQNFGLTVQQARALVAQMNALQNAKGVEAQAEASGRLTRTISEMLNSGVKLPPVFADIARNAGDMAIQGMQFVNALDSARTEAVNTASAAAGIPPVISEAAMEAMRLAQNLGLAMAQLQAVVAGIQTAQRTAQNLARISLETVGQPVERAGRIAEYKMLEDSGTAAYAAIRNGSMSALEETKRLTQEVGAGARVTETLQIQATDADQAFAKLASSAGKAGGAGKKAGSDAAKEAEKLNKELARSAERWRDLLDPVSKHIRDMTELGRLSGILSQSEMAEAQRRLNVELADSLPLAGEFVDIMTEGLFNGFSGRLDSLAGMFKKWLSEMIATAWKNRIVVGMGLGGGDALSSALGAAGAPVGGGGILGSVMGGASAFAGSLWGGASSVISGLATGGLSGGIGAIGSALGGISGGLAGLGTALGAVALPLAAVIGVFSFFKKKTKELDAGIRVTVSGMDTLVQEFRKTETKRFWGLSKKVRTSYDQADAETQDALSRVVGSLQTGVMDAAKVLGFGAQTFANFSHVMQVSTKGMSEEDALKAVQEAITGLGDGFADMIPGLARLAKDGETATQTLDRLSKSLIGVNGIMDTLGHRFRAAGLSGADAASKIADAFGGLEAMATATQAFYEGFYSDAERLATTTRQTVRAMAELGIAMPKTRNEYRAIIASLNLTTEKGRKTYAALIGLSGAFDLILPQIAGFTKEMTKLQDRVVSAMGAVIDGLSDAIKANEAAAGDWRKAGEGIREYLDKLRGTAGALFNPAQARAYNTQAFSRTLRQANRGNVEAAQNLPGAAQAYLGSVMDTARTREEAAMAQARVAAALGKVAVRTDTTAVALEQIARLQQQQVDILQKARDHIAAGNTLTKEGITSLLGKLGGLDEKILKRAGDASFIVAGVERSLKGTKVQANVSATVTGIATIAGTGGLTSAMGVLRGALVDLRAAIAAETKRQQDAVKKASEVVNKPVPKPATPTPATPAKPKGYTLADYRMSQIYNRDGEPGTVRIVGPLGGTKMISGSTSTVAAWLAAQNYPAFARGGQHVGGPAYVGEKDLELVAPSRIYSPGETKSMLDNREVVAELRKLRDELRAELSDVRTWTRKTAEHSRNIENIERDWQQNGIGIDPDQNKVSGNGSNTDYVAAFEAALS